MTRLAEGDEYSAYLSRFEAEVGVHEVGDFAKYQGRLVKKLTREEFGERWGEFVRLKALYQETFERGDTINDAMVRLLKERSADLILEPPL